MMLVALRFEITFWTFDGDFLNFRRIFAIGGIFRDVTGIFQIGGGSANKWEAALNDSIRFVLIRRNFPTFPPSWNFFASHHSNKKRKLVTGMFRCANFHGTIQCSFPIMSIRKVLFYSKRFSFPSGFRFSFRQLNKQTIRQNHSKKRPKQEPVEREQRPESMLGIFVWEHGRLPEDELSALRSTTRRKHQQEDIIDELSPRTTPRGRS